jgi:hypothetical protein
MDAQHCNGLGFEELSGRGMQSEGRSSVELGEDIPTPAPLGTGLGPLGERQTQGLILRAACQRNVRRANHAHRRPASLPGPAALFSTPFAARFSSRFLKFSGAPRAIRMGPVGGKHRSVRVGAPWRRAGPTCRGGGKRGRRRWPTALPRPLGSQRRPTRIAAQGWQAGRGRLGGTALIGNNKLLLATQRRLASADRTASENARKEERKAAKEARRRSRDNPGAEPDEAEEPHLDEPAAADLAEVA